MFGRRGLLKSQQNEQGGEGAEVLMLIQTFVKVFTHHETI